MNSIVGLRRRRMAIAAVAVFAVLGGIAYASIPDAAGVIHGCYRTSTDDQKGQLRVVEDPASCRSNELPIQWNEQGVAGATGPAGQDGADGTSPTVAQLAAGDANCPTGGAAIADAAGSTAYVCSGASGADGADGEPFSGTFTSPNGQYSLRVEDGGVTISSSDASFSLSNSGIVVQSLDDILLRSTGDLDLQSGASLELRAGSTATVLAGSGLALRGSSVNINGGGRARR